MKRNDYQKQPYTNVDNRKIWIRCLPGKDGGRQQSLHLIGIISDNNWQNYWHQFLKNNLESFSNLIHALEKLSLLNKIDQSTNNNKKKRNENIENDLNMDEINNVNIVWHIIYNQTKDEQTDLVWFALDNFTDRLSYDLIVYSKNSIGMSKPLVYFNVTVAKIFDDIFNSNYPINADKSGMIFCCLLQILCNL